MMFQRALDWFEEGDLVPLAVIISVAHYGPVLMAHGEHWLVAWSVGVLIDLLHFRSVRYAFAARHWLAAVVAASTTVMATGYHLRFYGGDWLLALPIPIGIGILAWHSSEKQRGALDGQLAMVNGQLQERESVLQEIGKALAEAEGRVKLFESKLNEAESKAKEADRLMRAAEKRAQGLESRWQKLGPVGQDMMDLIGGGEITQAEIAKRHGLSESAVSRVKAMLNGGAG
jgi:DNA-binding CsgD family transcriptional regulator